MCLVTIIGLFLLDIRPVRHPYVSAFLQWDGLVAPTACSSSINNAVILVQTSHLSFFSVLSGASDCLLVSIDDK